MAGAAASHRARRRPGDRGAPRGKSDARAGGRCAGEWQCRFSTSPHETLCHRGHRIQTGGHGKVIVTRDADMTSGGEEYKESSRNDPASETAPSCRGSSSFSGGALAAADIAVAAQLACLLEA